MFTAIIGFFKIVTSIFTRVIFKLEVRGVINIPSDGGVLVISNHVSFLDSMVIATAMNRDVGFVMAAKVYNHPLLHWAFKRLAMVPIESGKDKSYLQKFNQNCQKKINSGHAVCIYAEGQISNNGHLLEFKKGMEYIAEGLNSKVSILPVHIDGLIGTPFSYDNNQKKSIGLSFKSMFKKVVVTFGKPMDNSSSAFEVRQKIKELEVSNFSERISDNSTLIDYIYQNNHSWNGSLVLGSLTASDLWQKANSIAVQYRNAVGNYSLIGVYLSSVEDNVAVNVGMAILGKQVVNLNSKGMFSDLGVEMVISDQELDFNYLSYVQPELVNSDRWIETSIHKDVKLAKFNSNTGSFSMSHENILAYFFALKQLFVLGDDSRMYCQYNSTTAIGYFIKVWAPLLVNSTVVGDQKTNQANVIVGDTDFINNYHLQFGTEHLRTIILLDGNKGRLLKELNHSVVYAGLASASICPVITLSSPDYQGRSIAGKPLLQEGRSEGTVGKPFPGVTIKIVDAEGQEVDPGVKGTVMVKGIMFNADGWIKTGIEGYMTTAGFLAVL